MPRSRSRSPQLDAPLGRGTPRQRPTSRDRFGRFTEWVARAMGTPAFLLILTPVSYTHLTLPTKA